MTGDAYQESVAGQRPNGRVPGLAHCAVPQVPAPPRRHKTLPAAGMALDPPGDIDFMRLCNEPHGEHGVYPRLSRLQRTLRVSSYLTDVFHLVNQQREVVEVIWLVS